MLKLEFDSFICIMYTKGSMMDSKNYELEIHPLKTKIVYYQLFLAIIDKIKIDSKNIFGI